MARNEGKRGATSRHFQRTHEHTAAPITNDTDGESYPHPMMANFVRKRRRRADKRREQPAVRGEEEENLTEMEKQVVRLKEQYPDMLLLFECGYRMRMFGEDAEHASRVLGIRAQRHRAFMEASVPVHRALHHGRRLVAAGFKIGIVKQLRAVTTTPRQPLERDVVEAYTWATIPDESHLSTVMYDDMQNGIPSDSSGNRDDHTDKVNAAHSSSGLTFSSPRYILAIIEETVQPKRLFVRLIHTLEPAARAVADFENVRIGVFGHDIHTGESIFDEFEDDGSRTKIRAILSRIEPAEIVTPVGGVSPQTEQLLVDFSRCGSSWIGAEGSKTELECSVRRIERVTFKNVQGSTECGSAPLSEHATGLVLPGLAHVALSALASYLRSLKFEISLAADTIRLSQNHFSLGNDDNRLRLMPSTLTDLGLFGDDRRRSVASSDGSLFSMINHTKTEYGARRLKHWLQFPLTSINDIEERQRCIEALSEVSGDGAILYEALREEILPAAVGIERLLQLLHLRRATPSSLVRLLTSLIRVEMLIFSVLDDADPVSMAAQRLMRRYPRNADVLETAIGSIDNEGARRNDTEQAISKMWAEFPDEKQAYDETNTRLLAVQTEFQVTLDSFKRELNLPALSYSSDHTKGVNRTSGHLIVVDRRSLSCIPEDWLILSSTKAIVRCYPPAVRALQLKQDMLLETKAQVVASVWRKILASMDSIIYVKITQCVDILAALDCFASMATVVRLHPNYVRPIFTATENLKIRGGRHPTLEQHTSQGSSYIPNDVELGSATTKGAAMIISGPNMGGKSTLLRMIALLVVMAQMGSFVPAHSMTLPAFDAIHSRMHRLNDRTDCGALGAGDDELQYLDALMKNATAKSLVLLDEVGFGLSSAQVTALACSIVKYLLRNVRCRVVIATHIVEIVEILLGEGYSDQEFQARELAHHVSRTRNRDGSVKHSTGVVYYYTTRGGVANRSLALEAAAISCLPRSVLARAATIFHELTQTSVTSTRSQLELPSQHLNGLQRGNAQP